MFLAIQSNINPSSVLNSSGISAELNTRGVGVTLGVGDNVAVGVMVCVGVTVGVGVVVGPGVAVGSGVGDGSGAVEQAVKITMEMTNALLFIEMTY